MAAAQLETIALLDSAALRRLGLTRPKRIHANGKGIGLSDEAGGVAVFDTRGRVKWTARAGDIGYVADARLRGDSIWLLDRAANRLLTVPKPPGKPERIGLQRVGTLIQMVPLSGGRVIACQYEETPPCVVAGVSNPLPQPVSIPWPDYGRLHRLMRAATVGSDPRSDRWVFALSQGDGWLAFDGDKSMPYVGHFVEHHDFPDVIQDSSRAQVNSELARRRLFVLGATVADSFVTILFKSDDGKRYVDQYSYASGTYTRSMLADEHAIDVAAHGGVLYVLASSPVRVLVMRVREPVNAARR